MVKKIKYLVIALLILTALSFVQLGCKGTPANTVAVEILMDYLVANNMDLSDILTGWIIDAADVTGNETNYYIIDIRAAVDFALGHIPGAVNSTLGDILIEAANNGGLPIVVVCYTGQSAAHAVVALRLSGYADAKSLKFGMSSWHADFDRWTANTGDQAVGNANWTDDPTTAVADYNYPDLASNESEGAAILAERVDALLAGGFKGVNADVVLAAPGDYFINNYWAAADVTTYGHITGAYRINPLTIANDEIANLDPDQTIVTYCWTGQTSSIITAYLNVLGYDALSLKFGANNMIYNQLAAHKWTVSYNYAYEN